MRRNWNESVDILVQYGMERAKATRLLRVGILEDPLTGNTLRNLDLLSAYKRLNEVEHRHLLMQFLARDHALNREMEALPDEYDMPAGLRCEYLSDPTMWSKTAGDMRLAEKGLRLLTQDDGLIREIQWAMLTRGAYSGGEAVLNSCRRLSELSAPPKALEDYVREYSYYLFSCYSDVEGCLGTLRELVGDEKVFSVLMEHPDLPRTLSRNDCALDWEGRLRQLKEELAPGLLTEEAAPWSAADVLSRLVRLTENDPEGCDVRIAAAALMEATSMLPETAGDYLFGEGGAAVRLDSVCASLWLLSHVAERFGMELPDGSDTSEAYAFLVRLFMSGIGMKSPRMGS